MLDAQLNMFDTAVMVVIFLSTVIAFFRGFVKEVLSLGAWVGAGIITLYTFPMASEMLKSHVKNPAFAGGLAALITFVLALMLISILNALIIRYVREGAEIGLLDKFMGLIFGFARGAFIVSLGYFILTIMMPDKEKYPEWLKEAKSRDVVETGALALVKIAPNYFNDLSSLSKEARDQMQKKGADLKAEAETIKEKDGYAPSAKSDFDRILNSLKRDSKTDSADR